MQLKSGDSNKKFQNTFFKHQVKHKELNVEAQNIERNQNKFWSNQKDYAFVANASNEINALNVVVLMSVLSR